MPGFLFLTSVGVAAYIMAFPSVDFAPSGIVALTLWGLVLRRDSLGKAGWVFLYVAGVVLFAGGCAWIADVNPLFPLIMAIFEGLALPLFCLLYRFNLKGLRRPMPVWFALPMAWVAVEYLRTIFPLDGFPWLLFGYTL
ncbi:MAG: hypothetical protein KJ645_07240 [Planctomycetes bacterium]|nr:hypothetical protein [Planctomycetota bacterium]